MPNWLNDCVSLLRGFMIIVFFLALGKVVSAQLPIALPASIIGLLLLFLGLSTRLIKIEWVQPSANVFLKYMVILFIPISVALLNYFQLLLDNWLVILFSVFCSSLLIMLSVGHLFQFVNNKADK